MHQNQREGTAAPFIDAAAALNWKKDLLELAPLIAGAKWGPHSYQAPHYAQKLLPRF
jgi:hypothetical protein